MTKVEEKEVLTVDMVLKDIFVSPVLCMLCKKKAEKEQCNKCRVCDRCFSEEVLWKIYQIPSFC
jgi:hypothetical protein